CRKRPDSACGTARASCRGGFPNRLRYFRFGERSRRRGAREDLRGTSNPPVRCPAHGLDLWKSEKEVIQAVLIPARLPGETVKKPASVGGSSPSQLINPVRPQSVRYGRSVTTASDPCESDTPRQ